MYTSNMAGWMEEVDITDISYVADISVNVYQPDDWEKTITGWFKVFETFKSNFGKFVSRFITGSTMGSTPFN